jgi:hypothetical protein
MESQTQTVGFSHAQNNVKKLEAGKHANGRYIGT